MGFEESMEIIAERLKHRETERLKKRELERQLVLEKKREEREEKAASNEKWEFFIATFNEKRQQIEDALAVAASGSVEKSEIPYHFENVIKNIQSLKNYISQSAYFLRVYDIRKSQEALQILQQRCQEVEEWCLPKKKFSFKVRKTAESQKDAFDYKIEDCLDSPSAPDSHLMKPHVLGENVCGFSKKVGENLILKNDIIMKKDVVLSSLENCTIHLPGVPSTLHITNLHNCRVLCGPVVTSVFIEDCMECTFVLACQQLRIHNTRHSDFYLHVTSRSIIEDTKEVGFAPYTWKYDDVERHFQLAGLDMNRNNWDFVDDFNWLAGDKPSPHWRVLKANEQILEWL